MFDFWTRVLMYNDTDVLFEDARMLAPCEPMHPTFDDIRKDWLIMLD